jgi:hypothetical protein
MLLSCLLSRNGRRALLKPIAPVQKAQDLQRGSKKRGGPVIRGKEDREDRPNAVTPITLRLRTELRLCQVTIISYTRCPFLNHPSAPSCGIYGAYSG